MARPSKKVARQPEQAPAFPPILERSETDYEDQCHTEVLIEDQICVLQGFFTALNCRNYLSFFNEAVAPLLVKPVPPRRGEATRTNERYSVYNADFAGHLFHNTDLIALTAPLGLGQDGKSRLVGLNPNLRIYRYTEGAFFGPHYDDAVVDPVTKWKSAWTLLIYLSEGGLVGGETSFELRRGESITPKVSNGMALLHRHGHDCLLHEGKPVKAGTKWVLRTDLMYA